MLQDTSFVSSGNSPLASVQGYKSMRHEENSREALIKVAFIVKSRYPKTSTYSLLQTHSHHIKLPVPEIKQSLLSDNPAHKHNSGIRLNQDFSDVRLLRCSFTLD